MTRIRKTIIIAGLIVGIAAPLARGQAPATTTAAITKQPVAFRSDGLALLGYLFKPEGAGPFPTVLWNHASPRSPGRDLITLESAAAVFQPAGYVLFAPVRRGHEGSEGVYLGDEENRTRETSGPEEANRLVVRKLETEQLDDQLAGLAYLRRLPFVDTSRIVVAGCSYGGIQALLGAERGGGYRAAVSISPAALSWEGNPLLRERLLQAVGRIEIPVLLQPPKDASLEPSRVLGAEFRRLGKPFSGKIYPAEGAEDQLRHCFGGAKGTHVWAEDALIFLKQALR
jgi:carboxymethylenebutenolidase